MGGMHVSKNILMFLISHADKIMFLRIFVRLS